MNEFQNLPLSKLHESSWNPRRSFDAGKLTELVASVKQHGVLVPLLVRPNADGYEIAAGHRRFRAAQEAGLQELPVRIRVMSDTEFLEVLTIENLQREDVHPLDEAMGYRALMDKAGYDADAIAAKVGKSASYVYQRLKLSELIGPAQKAFGDDQITAGHAILIARLQPKDQTEALNASMDQWDGLMSVRSLAQWIDRSIHLDLHAAPFKKDDAELVPAAGPCTTCPKRTGFLPQLFPDIAKKDTCTDRACFDAKIEAHIARRSAEEQLVKISHDSGYSGNDVKQLERAGVLMARSYHKIEGKKDRCEHAQKAIIVHGSDRGQVVSVCTAKDCKVHRSNRDGTKPQPQPWELKQRTEEKRNQEKAAAETARRREIVDAILYKVTMGLDHPTLQLVAIGYLKEMQGDPKRQLWKAKGWTPVKHKDWDGADWDKSAEKEVAAMTTPQLFRFLVELALLPLIHVSINAYSEFGREFPQRDEKKLLEVAEWYQVDAKKIGIQVAAERDDRAAASRAKANVKKAKALQTSAKKKNAKGKKNG